MGRLDNFVWPFCCGWPALHLAPEHNGDQNCGFPVDNAEILAVKHWYHISRNLH